MLTLDARCQARTLEIEDILYQEVKPTLLSMSLWRHLFNIARGTT